MPDRSGYQPLAQAAEDEEADVGEGSQASQRRGLRRSSRPRHIDLGKLDTAFKRWTESIARKVKSKKKTQDNSRKEIWRSVFEPQIPSVPGAAGPVKTLDHKPPMTQADFDAIVDGIKQAILEGIHPKMITKGSSGSYFARVKIDDKIQTVGVFKPKDEEPYGRLNPKTTKWLHRQFKWIIPFGRACLIPNLSYISEAAASLLDQRMSLFIVPRTELVSISSPAFFYDWIDRNGAKKGKPLPDKIGSLQFFLHGFTDASDFLRKNPFPGRAIAETYDDNTHRHKSMAKRFLNAIRVICGRAGEEDDFYDDDEREHERRLFDVSESQSGRPFYWTSALQDSFREELEKLVILDSLMLNTDRGLDNFMIKYCESDHDKVLVDVAPSRSSHLEMPQMSELRRSSSPAGGLPQTPTMNSSASYAPRNTDSPTPYQRQPHIHIAAIDNSLSFPHEHPRGWRSYTYGWLYLPVSIIGRPFSEKTRNHFLPMLTSKIWWEETSHQLRQLFALDPDFHPKMFNKQMAVIKGQAWNIVQSLKHEDEGPLELTRRQKVLVWDDEVEMTDSQLHGEDDDDDDEQPDATAVGPASPHASINTMPLPSPSARMGIPRPRGPQTSASEFPPRRSGELPRPVSFSTKYTSVHPATTGVAILEHMERLDAVEASLKRLGVEESIGEEDEEDVADSSSRKPGSSQEVPIVEDLSSSVPALFSPSTASEYLPSVPEVASSNASIAEEDVAAMSKSLSHIDVSPSAIHARWGSRDEDRRGLDWIVGGSESPKSRTVIVERLETVSASPTFAC